MAREQLGPPPVRPDDATDVQWVEEGLATKYVLPPTGVPTADIADGAVTVDKLAADGSIPADNTWYRGDGVWAPVTATTVTIIPDADYFLDTPADLTYPMIVYEIHPVTEIVVTLSDDYRLVSGIVSTLDVGADRSAFIGIKWSDASEAWYVLAVGVEEQPVTP